MNICMLTNTYLPHVGGVARSVSTFAGEYRRLKHHVLVVAPEYDGKQLSRRAEAFVERVPALQRFNGSDFSVRLPLLTAMSTRIEEFQADIIHAHHPFLLGDTALRLGRIKNVPVVFTHHTRYEDYTHYVPFDSARLKDLVIRLSTQFANLCDGVIAPSQSFATLIRKRGVTAPIRVVPTGIDVAQFASGSGARFRQRFHVPADAFVVGHTGRLAQEKNLAYLGESVAIFLKSTPKARFLVIGSGPSELELRNAMERHGCGRQLILAGKQVGNRLADGYRAMDAFVFSSTSETQGIVVAEAMAAGLPVVALNAPGLREVVRHNKNGCLTPAHASPAVFARHIDSLFQDERRRMAFSREAQLTAAAFSKEACTARALAFYDDVIKRTREERRTTQESRWGILRERIALEWELLARKTQSIVQAVVTP